MFKKEKHTSFESTCMEKNVLILIFLTFASGMIPLNFSVKSRFCLNEPHETVIRIRGLESQTFDSPLA